MELIRRQVHECAMWVYRLGIGLASLSDNAKAKGWIRMRKDSCVRLQEATALLASDQQWMWFHCASVGEFEQARPVIEEWRNRHPHDAILLTFFSVSGWDAFAIRPPTWWRNGDHVSALPLDTRSAVRRFVRATERKDGASALRGLLFSKYDVWPNLIFALKQRGLPVGVFAAHVIVGRWPFRRGGKFYQQAWAALTDIWVQDQTSIDTLSSYGIVAQVAGDPRVDRVLAGAAGHVPDKLLQKWVGARPCVVIGSAWEAEWEVARKSWKQGACMIIVPHEWTSESMASEFNRWKELGARPVLWSEHRYADSRAEFPDGDILLVDAMGELLDLYAAGDAAVVGGGFAKGVHNTLEPAAHGKFVWVGPQVGRFREIPTMSEAGGLKVCQDENDLIQSLRAFFEQPEAVRRAGINARNFAESHAGAGLQIVVGWEKRTQNAEDS
ncbi:MAG: 3-deoxy-D-manno-octulosonic acid transferase [Flavobacteriales bacterium]